jgi:hypothetical protein
MRFTTFLETWLNPDTRGIGDWEGSDRSKGSGGIEDIRCLCSVPPTTRGMPYVWVCNGCG